ncbi:MAG: 2TM domain-containing protein [Lewinella sp.]|nr:2TM domain-containing protein [Lewinella sp.]
MDDYEIARKRVKAKQGFYAHFGVYVAMSAFFLFLNASTGGYPWFMFPVLGWGIGVAHHALNTFSQATGAKRGFLHHFVTFAMVTGLLFFINVSSGGPPWFLWPTLGWGVGVLAHFVRTFFSSGSRWEERQVEKEMRRLHQAPPSQRVEDDELELRELKRDKQPEKLYREDDLV